MSRLCLYIFIVLLSSPAWATTYHLAPVASGGNDSNPGTSANSPWLTPNHPVNCGDVILAAASAAYSSASFTGSWGAVTCPSGNNVAWLKCATFDACKISVVTANPYAAGMQIGTSFWGVQGWEVTTSSVSGECFFVYPESSNISVHHIIFANDVANGCGQGGFIFSTHGSAGTDYDVVVGSVAYNSVSGSFLCTSGIDVFMPVATDTLPGTHIYFGGDFAWNNVEPNSCNGTAPTDGEGIFFDTVQPYAQQMVIDNSISIFNGGNGIKAYNNSNGSPNANIYFRHNTTYGNETSPVNGAICSEIGLQSSFSSQVYTNLSMTSGTNGCSGGGNPYALGVSSPNSTDQFSNNFAYSAAGNNTVSIGTSFSFGPSNIVGTNPSFANPADPGPPGCSGTASVPNCMATLIANFTPRAITAVSYGYQVPASAQTFDPLFPQWLCNTNLPAGLVTMGCVPASALPGTVTITNVVVH